MIGDQREAVNLPDNSNAIRTNDRFCWHSRRTTDASNTWGSERSASRSGPRLLIFSQPCSAGSAHDDRAADNNCCRGNLRWSVPARFSYDGGDTNQIIVMPAISRRSKFYDCYRHSFDWPAWLLVATIAIGLSPRVGAADLKTKNVFLITTDGLRWQEVFTGAEEALLTKANGGVADEAANRKKFWRATPGERRRALLPFLWSEVAAHGQIYGNQTKGSVAHITNTRKFSYPGYSEFLTGVADARIDSNDKFLNPNTNVFEWLNTRPGFSGRVAAVVNWDVIPWILNTERSQLPVWTGFPLPPHSREIKISPELAQLLGDTTAIFDGIIFDSFTERAAVDYVKQAKPRALYVAFGETDEWAHEGRYDLLLESAHHVDRFIQRLWETAQALPEYRNQTTFIIATDHGRGDGLHQWRNHGAKVDGAENIWIAIFGPDTPPLGERENCAPVTQAQIAATVAAFLGQDFRAALPQVAAPINEAIRSGAN